MDNSPSSFRVSEVDGVVHFAGDMAAGSMDAIGNGIRLVLNEAADPVVVDLAGVSFCDSSGLGALVRLRRLAEPRGVVLRGPSPLVRRRLTMTGLDDWFRIDDQGE